MRVHPEGGLDADIFLVGEAPGAQEEEKGRVWVGKAGKELRRYIEKSSRLPLKRFWLTNLVKERPHTNKGRGNNAPTADDVRRDEPELLEEILNVKPTWVVAVGRFAARWWLGDVSIDATHGFAFPVGDECRAKLREFAGREQVPDLRELPRQVSRRTTRAPELRSVQTGGSGNVRDSPRTRRRSGRVREELLSPAWLDQLRVVVVTHPAAGLHQSSAQPQINVDFIRLGQYVRGELDPVPPVDQFPDPDYYEVRTSIPAVSPRDVAFDTESRLDGTGIWGGSYSFHPGSGAVVQAANRRLLPSLRDLLFTHRIGLHNAPHDLRVIAKWLQMPIHELCEHMRFECTMQMAYVYRLLPLALKSIGKRFFGMPAVEYRDVVGSAGQELAVQYLVPILDRLCQTCGGVGEIVEDGRTHKTSGKPLDPRMVTCPACAGDGTSWLPPAEQLKWDPKKKQMTTSGGQRMGTRVRKALERVEAGTVDVEVDEEEAAEGNDKPVVGLQKWWTTAVDYEFRLQVEREFGPIPEPTLHNVDPKVAVDYAARDADMTIRFWPYVEKLLRDEGLWSVYEVDRDAMPMFCEMMDTGWKIDVDYLGELSCDLAARMDVLTYQLEKLAGHYVNPGSSPQVADLLFGRFGLEPVQWTETGMPSTSDDVLGDLQLQAASDMDHSARHRTAWEGLELIRNHRELSKLKSTYTVKLPRMVDAGNRVHTELKQAVTESRRPASRNPNLANIPKRKGHAGENGKLVRHAFTCEPGNVLVEIDFSQIEFRVLAHEAQQLDLIDAINRGLDPHALTTSKIFGVPIAKVDKEGWQRQVSKTVSFLILYGGSAPLLKSKLKTEAGIDVPVEECQRWIDDYTGARGYAQIGQFIEDSAAMARRYGYVFDSWGHRRHLPGIYSELYGVRAEAERIAVNHRIQSYVSGVIKLAMIRIWNDVMPKYRKRGYCKALMQIYDSLVLEVKRELAEEFRDEVAEVMSGVVELSVKLTADGKIGERWSELE